MLRTAHVVTPPTLTTPTAWNAGFSRHSPPQAGGGTDLIRQDGATAWNAGLQTGTRGAPHRARRNPTHPHDAYGSQRLPAPSDDSPRKLPGDSDVETPAPPGAGPAGGSLFHALLAAGVEPAAAYTAVREMESMAGQSVVAQLSAQIQSFAGEVRNDLQEVKSRLSGVESGLAEVRSDVAALKNDVAVVKSDVAVLKSDVAVLKKEVRLIWGALSLLVVTLTAILIHIFAN